MSCAAFDDIKAICAEDYEKTVGYEKNLGYEKAKEIDIDALFEKLEAWLYEIA